MLFLVAQQTAQGMIDWSPLIPVINGLIATIASLLVAAIPVVGFYVVKWLRAHGIAVDAKAAVAVAQRLDSLVSKAQSFAEQDADSYVTNKLIVPVPRQSIATTANYMIAQAPDFLKKIGSDPTTVEGQQAIVRFIIARLVPSAPTPDSTLGVTITPGPSPTNAPSVPNPAAVSAVPVPAVPADHP